MDTRKMATEYRMAQWSQLLKERRENGETITEFCKRIGVSKNTYCYWQKKLREAACEQLAESTTALTPSGWAVCKPAESSASSTKIFVEIGNYRVSVDNGFNPDLLAQVCKTLVEIC